MSDDDEVEQLRRKASAAKSLLSRRYNEMNEALRNSSSTFEDFCRARDIYHEQQEVFDAAVTAWKDAHEADSPTQSLITATLAFANPTSPTLPTGAGSISSCCDGESTERHNDYASGLQRSSDESSIRTRPMGMAGHYALY